MGEVADDMASGLLFSLWHCYDDETPQERAGLQRATELEI